MARSPVVQFLLLLAVCFAGVQSTTHNNNQVQFYNKASKYGAAITSALYENGTQVRFQIVAPVHYGWVALGSGAIMDGSVMFILYPDESGDALTLSTRTTTAHNTPTLLESGKVDARLISSSVKDGIMSGIIQWRGDTKGVLYDACDVSNPKQPFIWAVGPDQKINSNDPKFPIRAHDDDDNHGTFFADMPQSQNMQILDPDLNGVDNINATAQPDYYFHLIVVHACLLVGAFMAVFPAAVVALRLNLKSSFKMHWISQVVGTAGVLAGLVVAIFASMSGIQFSSLTEPHQIIGIVVCFLVGLQVYFGREHHIHFVLYRKRTWYSHVHMLLGRVIMYGGMINASLGLRLAGLGKWGLAANVVGIILIIIVEVISARHNFRRSKNLIVNYEPLGLKDLSPGKNKDVAVEERMLSDVERYDSYGR